MLDCLQYLLLPDTQSILQVSTEVFILVSLAHLPSYTADIHLYQIYSHTRYTGIQIYSYTGYTVIPDIQVH